MKILKLRFKNFFSSGNSFLEIDLLKYHKSVISGTNGNGKSTIANAITFALFDKTIKKVNKGQIVNSINGKGCVVEIEFIGDNTKKYLIRRGIKPNLFEIFEDTVLIDQSSMADYQDFLEEKILKCNYRTFLQTSIISIENYIPFMSMPKASRREFIEDILDIRVFTTMNQLLKSKVSKNKEELRLLDVSFKSARERIVLQKSHIELLEAKKLVGVRSLDEKIEQYNSEISIASEVLESDVGFADEIAAEKAKLVVMQKQIKSINQMISDMKTQIRTSEKDISFFEANTDCPTCRQHIEPGYVYEIIGNQKEVNAGLKTNLIDFNAELDKYSHYDDAMSALNSRESKHNSKISVANSTITRMNRMIADVNREKIELLQDDDVAEQKVAMSEAAKGAIKLRDRQLEITEEQNYNVIMLELFKDSGVKSKIVDQYVSTINLFVNEYLEKLDFFVSFTLDSEFNETIKSRHRDDFTYSSFSAGEKMRIDLALLFTFRKIAKMKNAFSCNLLLLDEIMDASCDAAGIELLMGIFNDNEFLESNIMVISHRNKDAFEDAFDGVYDVYKRDGFTCIHS